MTYRLDTLGLFTVLMAMNSCQTTDTPHGAKDSAVDLLLSDLSRADGPNEKPDRGVSTDGAAQPDALGTDHTLSAKDYCTHIVDFFCPFYLRCGRMAEADLQGCKKTFLETCQGVYQPHYVALEKANLLALSERGIAACKKHLETVPCQQQLLDLVGPCRELWLGRQQKMGGCGISYDGLICDDQSVCIVGPSLCGQCKQAATTGDPCGKDMHCRFPEKCVEGRCANAALPQESCGPSHNCIAGATCVSGQCVARIFAKVGETCSNARRCVYRAACIGGKCVRKALLGQPCDVATAPCASGHCDQSKAICEPLRAPDAPCDQNMQCLSGRCVDLKCTSLLSRCL